LKSAKSGEGSSAPNRSTSERGNRVTSTGGISLARAVRKNALSTKAPPHHAAQRRNVRLGTALATNADRLAASTTTAAYTRRPRKRTDGGVSRFRQPPREQHSLNRRETPASQAGGIPRGLRGKSALSTAHRSADSPAAEREM
jgi:hypothetical protein